MRHFDWIKSSSHWPDFTLNITLRGDVKEATKLLIELHLEYIILGHGHLAIAEHLGRDSNLVIIH